MNALAARAALSALYTASTSSSRATGNNAWTTVASAAAAAAAANTTAAVSAPIDGGVGVGGVVGVGVGGVVGVGVVGVGVGGVAGVAGVGGGVGGVGVGGVGGVGVGVVMPRFTLSQTVFIALVSGMLSFITVSGNIMVMVSFKIDKQLQNISNYFLFSLALADFFIGLISMPLFTVYTILGYWPFGRHVCDGWLALDYLASNASVLNLLLISFDRYLSVTRPLTYRAKRTKGKALLFICKYRAHRTALAKFGPTLLRLKVEKKFEIPSSSENPRGIKSIITPLRLSRVSVHSGPSKSANALRP